MEHHPHTIDLVFRRSFGARHLRTIDHPKLTTPTTTVVGGTLVACFAIVALTPGAWLLAFLAVPPAAGLTTWVARCARRALYRHDKRHHPEPDLGKVMERIQRSIHRAFDAMMLDHPEVALQVA